MIHVIINPAAGQNTAVLATLNSVFQPAGIPWRVSITQQAGDAKEQARAAAQDGVDVVAVYGGDGTVVEAADGLIDSEVPLAILPGGTANVVAQELGIPQELTAAALLATGEKGIVRHVDMGRVNEDCFLLRVGLGAEARITEGADRELKNRLGFFAYLWSAAQSLATVEMATYHLSIDGRDITVDGITCAVINSGNLGLANLQIAPDIAIDDGLLDVIVIQNANLPALAEMIGSVAGLTDATEEQRGISQYEGALHHWKGKEIIVRSEPVQVAQYDGEMLKTDCIHCQILPRALHVLVPAPGES
ncbi:MAG: diacylglycerol kinase family lipid kinase [Caldilineaceae bacterium]